MTWHFKTTKSPELVVKYLSEMDHFVTIHPVIFKIEPKGDHQYLVHETLKFGFIPISFTYPVVVQSDAKAMTVSIRDTVKKITQVDLHFKISRRNDFTEIEESIFIKSPLPLKFVMERIFKTQHTKLFENLEEIKG